MNMTKEEAIRRIKSWNLDSDDMEVLSAAIPELVESEDERVRKRLIERLSHLEIDCPEDIEEEIAYLEKQKEQTGKKWIYEDDYKSQLDAQYQQGLEDGRKEQKHSLNFGAISSWLRDHASNYVNGEFNKFHHCVDYDGTIDVERLIADLKVAVDIADLKVAVDGGTFDVYEQKEQKPAEWSEEDEKIRKTLLDYYGEALDNYTCVEWLNGITYGELCDWLKSLLERFNLQPKQEWSEEDEKIMQTMIKDGDLKPSEIAWLKDRRPSKDCSGCAKHLEGYISGRIDAENKLLEQFGALITPEDELHIKPRWKPSEEQMNALYDVIHPCDTVDKEQLESLYEQLKKL